MAGASVVPLPVLVERVDLHPPPGVGHRAGRGPRPSGPGTVSKKSGRAAANGKLRDLSAAAGRRGAAPPLAWPAPGAEPGAAFARLPLLGAIVQAG